MNGLESFILEKYLNKENSWLPVGRALVIKELNMHEGIDERIEGIGGQVEEMERGLRGIGIDFSKFDQQSEELEFGDEVV